jgi:TRAP-type transport system periplasmic protein
MKLQQIHLLLLFFLLLFCDCKIRHQDQRPRIVKLGLTHNSAHSFTKALEIFAAKVEEKTNHRYQLKIYHSAQLGGEQELQQMLSLGSLEIALTGVLNSYEPLFSVFELPYLYNDREHVLRVNNSPIMEDVAASLHPKGLQLIGFYENGFRHITNSVKPVITPDDLSGLLIRTPENMAQIETMRVLGAKPTPMSFSDLYTALVQGVVDGQENPLQNIWNGRFYEAQKYLTMTRHIYNSVYIVAAREFWLSLPEQDKEIFLECLNESTIWQLDYMITRDEELVLLMQQEGMEITFPDTKAFEEATRATYEIVFKQLGPEARNIISRIKKLTYPIKDATH